MQSDGAMDRVRARGYSRPVLSKTLVNANLQLQSKFHGGCSEEGDRGMWTIVPKGLSSKLCDIVVAQ